MAPEQMSGESSGTRRGSILPRPCPYRVHQRQALAPAAARGSRRPAVGSRLHRGVASSGALASNPGERWPDSARSEPRWARRLRPCGPARGGGGGARHHRMGHRDWRWESRVRTTGIRRRGRRSGRRVNGPGSTPASCIGAEPSWQRTAPTGACLPATRHVSPVNSGCWSWTIGWNGDPTAPGSSGIRSRLSLFSEPCGRLVGASLAPAAERIERLEELTGDYRDWPLPGTTWARSCSTVARCSGGAGAMRSMRWSSSAPRLRRSCLPGPIARWRDIAAGDSAAASAALTRLHTSPCRRARAGAAAACRTRVRLSLYRPAAWSSGDRDRSDPALLAGVPELAAGPRVLPGLGTPEGGVLLGRAFEADPRQAAATLRPDCADARQCGPGRLDSARKSRPAPQRDLSEPATFAFAVMLDAAVVLLDDETSASEAAQVEASLTPSESAIMPPPVRRDAAWLTALAAIRRRDPAAARAMLANVAENPRPDTGAASSPPPCSPRPASPTAPSPSPISS